MSKDAVGFQFNIWIFQQFLDVRGGFLKAPFFSVDVLGQPVEAQYDLECVFVKKLAYFFGQQAPVGRERIDGFFAVLIVLTVQERYGFSYQAEIKERLTAVKIKIIIFTQMR